MKMGGGTICSIEVFDEPKNEEDIGGLEKDEGGSTSDEDDRLGKSEDVSLIEGIESCSSADVQSEDCEGADVQSEDCESAYVQSEDCESADADSNDSEEGHLSRSKDLINDNGEEIAGRSTKEIPF